MSVYIKYFEIPKNCDECPLRDECEMSISLTKRPFDCPIIEIKEPHYELIDRNALNIAIMNGHGETRYDFLQHVLDCINNAPVVVPASEVET